MRRAKPKEPWVIAQWVDRYKDGSQVFVSLVGPKSRAYLCVHSKQWVFYVGSRHSLRKLARELLKELGPEKKR